jgi:hypothetical protein
MGATKLQSKKKGRSVAQENGALEAARDVMTLAEAAASLRVAETDVLASVAGQGLPGRQVNGNWRFLRSSLRDWLAASGSQASREILRAMAGKYADDPFLEEIAREAIRKRGRPSGEVEA